MNSFTSKLLWLSCLFLLLQKGISAPVEEEDEYANDDYANDEDEENEEDGYTGPPPEILSKGRQIDIKEMQDILLPCETRNTDSFTVLWLQGKDTLFLENNQMKQDKRYSLSKNRTLAIRHAQTSDSGDYFCRIAGSNPLVEIHYSISVFAPPVIVSREPDQPEKIIEKGSALTLGCDVKGTPTPVVTWRRKGDKPFLNGDKTMTGTSLTFENIDRHYSGVYICSAENKHGQDTATFDIKVRYKPEIEIAEETITTNVDLEPEMTCTVHANPPAEVNWYRAGVAVVNSPRVQIRHSGNKHTLLIKGMQRGDFDSYTCFAKNSYGSERQIVTLSGAPSRPQVKVSYTEGQLPELKWSVESHLPVQVYELQYTSLNQEKKAMETTVSDKEGNIYSGLAVMKDIVPGESEVTVRAKNEFGWSEVASFKVTSGESSSGAKSAVIFSLVLTTSIAAIFV